MSLGATISACQRVHRLRDDELPFPAVSRWEAALQLLVEVDISRLISLPSLLEAKMGTSVLRNAAMSAWGSLKSLRSS